MWNFLKQDMAMKYPKNLEDQTKCGNKGYINEDGFSDHFPISLVIEEK